MSKPLPDSRASSSGSGSGGDADNDQQTPLVNQQTSPAEDHPDAADQLEDLQVDQPSDDVQKEVKTILLAYSYFSVFV